MTGRWWRRNWWALVAVIPVLLGMVLLSPDNSYQQWRDGRADQPVSPGQDGWAEFAQARLRLAAVDPADLRGPDGDPFPLPAGLHAWLAIVTVDPPEGQPGDERDDLDDLLDDLLNGAPDDELADGLDGDQPLRGCRVLLEDDAGRLFGDNPDELRGARVGESGSFHLPATCTPPSDAEGDGAFDMPALFVLPSAAQPVAVRVTMATRPDYAWLPVA